MDDLALGKATDLGGGVFKKRLEGNRYRSIIAAKSDDYWVLEFLFAKNDAENITDQALDGFRIVANGYCELTKETLAQLLKAKDLEEICGDTSN